MPALAEVAADLADRALRVGAEAAEVFILDAASTRLSIERNEITGSEATRSFGIALRLLKGSRLGFAYATDPERAEETARSALELPTPKPAESFRFTGEAHLPRVEGLFDPKVADLTPEGGMEIAERMMQAAWDLAPGMTLAGGGVGWGVERIALATTEGFRGSFESTSLGASLSGVLRNGETTTGYEYASARNLAGVDPEAVGRACADLALASRNAQRAEFTGPVSVLLKPEAMGGLFGHLFVEALRGERAHRGESVYSERVGARVLPEAFSVVDDGARAGGLLAAPFDDEGVPARRLPLVEAGVLKSYLLDRGGAAKYASESTGAAVRADRLSSGRTHKSPPAATGRNLAIDGPAVPLDELIRDTKEGVLVHDAMGAHTANAASGDFSVNSSTLFRIRKGEVVGAAKPSMVSGNLPGALERLRAVANDAKPTGSGFSPAVYYLPTVRLEGLRVTG